MTASEFGEWVRPHWIAMYRLARRLCAADHSDDVVQDALSAAWRKRSQFDPERGSAQSWLLAIVADQAYKQHRRRRPTVELISDVIDPAGTGDWPGIDLSRAIGQLTRRQQLAVTLHYYLGMPIAETADVMACSPGTVKSTLYDARQRLRTLLGDDYR
jgi:RNA polymerase sigma factor (sigma-70 family)